MDHLARPRADLSRVIDRDIITQDHAHSFKIRYLHDKDLEYDGSRFHEFRINEANISGGSSKVASFLQSWLFFGLMKEIFEYICGIEFDWRDFIRTEEGCDYSVITTEKLDMLIYLWHAREADASATEKYKRLDQILNVLHTADIFMCAIRGRHESITADTNLDDPGAPEYPVEAAVKLSIKILGMTLCEAIMTVYGEFVPIADAKSEPLYELDLMSTKGGFSRKAEFRSSYYKDPIISQLLKRAGYCPYQVETCDREYLPQGNLGLRWFLTFLNRRGIPGDHSECTMERCNGYQVDETTYETKHHVPDCDCEAISFSEGFDVDLILSCVRRGGTPLIQVDFPCIRIFQMGVDKGPTPPYVAISHVWSEGMGNPRENALPRCQLSILQYSANRSCPDLDNMHFWIDTICIPINHEKERKQEIKKMASIYSAAEKVVVLDQSLMGATSNTYHEEILIRIWKSPWVSRLWTLQEGRLSKSLSFFFGDKFYELEHVKQELLGWRYPINFETDIPSWMDRYERQRDPTCYRMIEFGAKLEHPASMEAWARIQRLMPLPSTDKFPPLPRSFISRIGQYNRYRVVRVTAAAVLQSIGSNPPSHRYSSETSHPTAFRLMLATLTMRNLTRPEDEAVCLATLLGRDVEPILKEKSPEARMRVLLTSMGTLPLGILFIESERQRDDGFTWIPRTLLRPGERISEGYCECQPDGRLMYQGPALVSTRPFSINKSESYFTVRAEDGSQYFVGIHPQPGLEVDDKDKIYAIIPSFPPLTNDHIPQRVVVLSLSPDQDARTMHSENQEIQTQYEFAAWLFELSLPGTRGHAIAKLATSGQDGLYEAFQHSKEHWWKLNEDTLNIIPFNSLTKNQKVLIR